MIRPRIIPALDESFTPAALVNRALQQKTAKDGTRLVIGLERNDNEFSRFETQVFPEGHPDFKQNLEYVERLVKFLLWQRGGFKVYIGGPREIGAYVRGCYSADGERKFDHHFMSEQVYEQGFEVLSCSADEVPASRETGKLLGRNLEGHRIGFDLGASDRKVSAVVDGRVIYSEEVIWEPRNHSNPEYHYNEIMTALKTAASKMARVDAIGGSSAGIYIGNRPMVASLFRGIPKERFGEIKNLFTRIKKEMNVPLDVINDGDVTALAGSMSIEDNSILGIALGSSEAAGYVDMGGHITGWLNELAFAPIDYSPAAPSKNGPVTSAAARPISRSNACSASRRRQASKSLLIWSTQKNSSSCRKNWKPVTKVRGRSGRAWASTLVTVSLTTPISTSSSTF